MLTLPSLKTLDGQLPVRLYVCTAATDMRKGLDSLSSLVREQFGQVYCSRFAAARWLVARRANVNLPCKVGGKMPLVWAIYKKNLPMVRLLVRSGANVNAKWHGHAGVLGVACRVDARRIVRFLKEHGAR